MAPRVVQAPAREALEMVGASRPPSPAADGHRMPRSASATARTAVPHQRSTSAHPGRERPGPRIEVPPMAPGLLAGNPDVCALGRSYGGWRRGSPEADICRSAYGR